MPVGHGAEQAGKHYLIPQEFPDKENLEDDAIEQQQTLERIKRKSPLVTLAILDCCRESAEVRAGYGGGEGLTGLAGPVGSLVMYATGEGGYAKDGLDGSEHGVFTDALLKVLDQPGLNLIEMCSAVQKEVESVTGGEQKPDFQAGGGMMEVVELQKISLVAKAEAAAPEPEPAGMAVPAGMEKWDTDGDGYLNAAELQAMNASAGLGAPPAGASPRPAAAIKTLADFVAACDDVDSMDELLEYSSPEDFASLLEEYSALLKDKTKTPGRKQREKLLSEHALLSGGGAAHEAAEVEKTAAAAAAEQKRADEAAAARAAVEKEAAEKAAAQATKATAQHQMVKQPGETFSEFEARKVTGETPSEFNARKAAAAEKKRADEAAAAAKVAAAAAAAHRDKQAQEAASKKLPEALAAVAAAVASGDRAKVAVAQKALEEVAAMAGTAVSASFCFSFCALAKQGNRVEVLSLARFLFRTCLAAACFACLSF
eukprot:COSAG06_NODE_3739_length_4957_cov_37.565665_2_plen_486_part_00